jgi:hypothetical protein
MFRRMVSGAKCATQVAISRLSWQSIRGRQTADHWMPMVLEWQRKKARASSAENCSSLPNRFGTKAVSVASPASRSANIHEICPMCRSDGNVRTDCPDAGSDNVLRKQ